MSDDIIIDISTPESGVKGEQMICSLSLKCVATWNGKDEKISIWQKSSSANEDIELNVLIEKLSSITNINFHKLVELVDISDEKLLILELESDDCNPYRVVYDLNYQRSLIHKYTPHIFVKWKFLENGNLLTMHHEQSNKSRLKIELYFIENGSFKLKRSYFILTNYYDNSYLFSQGQLMHGSKYLRQWNVIKGSEDFDHQYYLGCSKSVQVCFNESLLAVRKLNNSLIIYSKKTGMAFFQRLQVKIKDIGFCKESDLLIVQEDNESNIDGFNYHFIDPYFGNILYTQPIKSKHKQLIIHENVISIVDNSVQIENIFENTKEQLYREMSTHLLLSMTNSASIIRGCKGETKEFSKCNECDEYVEVSSTLLTWKIYKSERKLSANINSQEIDCIILDERLSNIFYFYMLPNDDIVIHTNHYGIIFTLNNQNKIELLFFSQLSIDDEHHYSYENDSFEIIFNKFTNQPIIIEMIVNYLDDITKFTLYASYILQAAIKCRKGDIIDHIIEKCIDHYNKNPENIHLFKIVTYHISEIRKYNHYYVKKFFNYTTLIKAPQKIQCEEVTGQRKFFLPIFILFEYHHLYGFTHDTDANSYLLKSTFFLNIIRSLRDNSYSLYNYLLKPFSKKRSAIKLYIPLPQFASYNTNYNPVKEFFLGPEKNEFLKLKDSHFYSDWNGEALLNFKWKKFGRFYYYINWLVYIAFLITFSLAIHGNFQKVFFIISAILGFFQLLFFEVRQFLWNMKKYFFSIWNWFDLIAYILPIVISIRWLMNHPLPAWVSSVSIFFLELRFIFYLRVFEQFSFIIIVYTHAFIVLNSHNNFFDSFLAIYKLMTGDTTNLEFQKNPELIVIWISFSVFTVIYLLNLFIGLLNEEIQKIDKKTLFLHQRAEILAEIELFNLFPSQRRLKSWFPDHIYYYVNVDELQRKLNEINSSDTYKDSPYKPIIHPDLLDLITCKITNSIENGTYNSISERINFSLLKNKGQISITLKFKGKKLIDYIDHIVMDNDDDDKDGKEFKNINLEENNIQDYLKSIQNIIKSNVSKNKHYLNITLEFKGARLVKYESQVAD
ncbi:hypothetical protein RhiirC2_847179 [Rhizophagus irregularis]|uniref:Ion transport domain-containing protein n=1 Tax=Rhizophagus irregularis TaxID=588596 RepID=A0A2N1NJB4_9GLOM|nr:hypothetical protein RhiirC2_847179 [Rhizophagus irregularis]